MSGGGRHAAPVATAKSSSSLPHAAATSRPPTETADSSRSIAARCWVTACASCSRWWNADGEPGPALMPFAQCVTSEIATLMIPVG